MEPIVNAASLKEQAYRSIKEAILSLQLKPSDPLVEADLARQLGISKTPVRDALFELEKEGLVVKIIYKGTYVSQLSHNELLHIFDIRAVLEGLAARTAARTFSLEDCLKAEEILKAQCGAVHNNDLETATRMNKSFHEMIISKSDNDILKDILKNLDDKLKRYRILSAYLGGRLDKSCQEHKLVLESLQAHDPGLSEKYLRAHLRSVAEDMMHENKFMVGEQEYDLTDG